ncbi:putative adhesin [Bordetella genomosp. 11]|uniref:putative adhesin n=1 Tax=Bordetella genomosp. 11 TaxID=1416808 RepID=UPI0011402107|nr:hypothetical protein [Bordetella genomosp. 11]
MPNFLSTRRYSDPSADGRSSRRPLEGDHQLPELEAPPRPSEHFSRLTDISSRFPLLPDEGPYRHDRLVYDKYMLWRMKGRKSTELIISSHGGQLLGRRTMVPPGTAFHFYGPNHAPLLTTDIYLGFVYLDLDERPYEIMRSGQFCSDFALAEYQDTYENYDDVWRCMRERQPYTDVVTIRGKAHGNGWQDRVLFSELLADLRAKNHRYSKIHCIFCRNFAKGTVDTYPALEPYVKPPYAAR